MENITVASRVLPAVIIRRNLWINYYPGPGLDKPDFSSVLKQIDLWLDGHSEMESF